MKYRTQKNSGHWTNWLPVLYTVHGLRKKLAREVEEGKILSFEFNK